MDRSALRVRPLRDDEREWLNERLVELWGSPLMVSRGRLHKVVELPGFVCEAAGERVGVVTYELRDDQCELITINALSQRHGVGSALLQAVVDEARRRRCRRLWLITTNDNLQALGFYQRRGLQLAAIHVGAVEESRRLKPSIPLVAESGIAIRDELELELELVKDEGGRRPGAADDRPGRT